MLELLRNDQVVSFLLSVVLLIVTYLFRFRVRIVWTISHGFLHHLKGQDIASRQIPPKNKNVAAQSDMFVWVRTLMVMNRGRVAAENVEITLNWKPLGLSVFPQRAYSEGLNPDDRYVLMLPSLASHETVSVHMLDVKELPNVTSVRSKTVWPAAGFTDTELRCFDGTGGFKCRERSSAASSSLRR